MEQYEVLVQNTESPIPKLAYVYEECILVTFSKKYEKLISDLSILSKINFFYKKYVIWAEKIVVADFKSIQFDLGMYIMIECNIIHHC